METELQGQEKTGITIDGSGCIKAVPLYNGFESSGMWAVMTVVVVFEFTVGATLSKGLNRGFATILAGALGVGAPPEFHRKIQQPCMKMSLESGKALKELALAIKTFAPPSSVDVYIESSKRAMDELKTVLEAVSRKGDDLLGMIPSLNVSSILTDIVKCVEKIDESIHELSRQAQFKNAVVGTVSPAKPRLLHRGIVKLTNGHDGDGNHVIVSVHGTSSD
ncbi:hypothetical protein RHGRI_006896 [Rhododendron griersonianum]|uniref:Uncharacterized protein n=1 Tax=Rhododendron griersonianum TaxID=479676 RepID=A0AAV6KUZ5_9ERIC|nr:hypothetical protein RHGRI_006896 [Rhododendron griersonianum]